MDISENIPSNYPSREVSSASTVKNVTIEAPKRVLLEHNKHLENKSSADQESLYRREATMYMIQLLTAHIHQKPDASLDELKAYARSINRLFPLTKDCMSVLKLALKEYVRRHDAVKSIRTQAPDDKTLFKKLFGMDSEGKVRIEQGKITLNVVCFNSGDYAILFNRTFFSQDKPNQEQISNAQHTGGAHLKYYSSLVPELEGCITIENGSGRARFRPFIYRRSAAVHEEQHAIKQLFTVVRDNWRINHERKARLLFNSDYSYQYKMLQDFPYETFKTLSAPEQLSRLKELFREGRKYGEGRCSDELLAYFKEGTLSEEIFHYLTLKKSSGGLYDYFSADEVRDQVDYVAGSINKASGINIQDLAEEAAGKVFDTEYAELISNGIASMEILETLGFSREQVVNLLLTVPLRNWQALTSQYLRQSQFPLSFEEAKGIVEDIRRTEMQIHYKWRELAEEYIAIGELISSKSMEQLRSLRDTAESAITSVHTLLMNHANMLFKSFPSSHSQL